ncbi:hypothetical protein [Sphingomonas sp. DBB INV C78]|uniref:hypothetical protein n=1 Tax=Sphingomonas sp. DBB INV C78 TaxID=3349434 RepID=UPI0036D32AA8
MRLLRFLRKPLQIFLYVIGIIVPMMIILGLGAATRASEIAFLIALGIYAFACLAVANALQRNNAGNFTMVFGAALSLTAILGSQWL